MKPQLSSNLSVQTDARSLIVWIVRRLLLLPLLFSFLSDPLVADQFECNDCMDRCKASYGLDSCYYNCNSFMNRPGPPPMPTVATLFGAIAFDASTLKAGFAKNAASREDAETTALADCRKSGAGSCKILVTRNNSYLALVTSQEGSNGPAWGYAYSDDGWAF